MIIGVPKEVHLNEKRVALTPDVARKIQKWGFQIQIESGAGHEAHFHDDLYHHAGCEICPDAKTLWQTSDIILKIRPPEIHPLHNTHEADWLHEGQTLVSLIYPGQNKDLLEKLTHSKSHVLAMDCVPRISRAQKLDVLSSMANLAGYRAVIEAAEHFDRLFMGQITAAGKIPATKVLVIGAGVAGLAAIGAATSLGAQVRAFDTRPEVKEQIQSMGAEFLEIHLKEEASGQGGYAKQMSAEFLKAEHELFLAQAREVDIIITTALIPGRPAPLLLPSSIVEAMKPGSVIVDLAAEQGGNCELTLPGKVNHHGSVKIIGFTDLPSRMASQASQLYGSNLSHLLEELCPKKDGVIAIDFNNEILRGVCVIQSGNITWPPPKIEQKSPPPVKQIAAQIAKPEEKSFSLWWFLALGVSFLFLSPFLPTTFANQLTIFILACFIGRMVIGHVASSLHTPLMSVTNAISGIIALGAILQMSSHNEVVQIIAASAVFIATINIVGGFLVSHRMIKMFKK